MSCPFYSFRNNDYYCEKKSDYINSDCYYRYCRAYSYDECPIYKGEGSSGGCYISSACFYSLGEDDNCYELQLLRKYRDGFLKKQSYGEDDINEYYKYTPQIVDAIDKDESREKIYIEIFNKYIEPCIKFIEGGRLKETYSLYKKMFYELKTKYIR